LLVGGFPCQDYSVARTLSHSTGLIGKKGVLWWQIYRILKEKGSRAPKYLMLENVDRLLKSPSTQRGRDFAIMLSSLSKLGYAVEWRVINAADYGMPQRRRRVYILGYKKNTNLYKEIRKTADKSSWIKKDGVIAKAFPAEIKGEIDSFELSDNLKEISDNFNKNKPLSPFKEAGVMIDRKIYTSKFVANHKGKKTILEDIIQEPKDIPKEYYLTIKDLENWKYLKGAKKEKRKTKNGFEYIYTEGSMIFPDSLKSPSRTIVTGEGGASPSRFKHVIKTKEGKYRRLTPIELERLNMFPDNHTEGVSDIKRAFFMGNALVIGVIELLGKFLAKYKD
jgi:DNA (cytosine-5)-methyltransferase 1